MAFGHATSAQDGETGELDCVIEPKQTVKLGSAADGILSDVMVERGDIVKKGDEVAKLDSELERLAADLARLKAERDVEVEAGKARLEFRQREVERVAELRDRNLASEKVFEGAKIEQQLAQFGVGAAEMDKRIAGVEHKHADARLDRRTVRSPVDGIVVNLMMSPGEFVNEQTPIMNIAQVNPLHVEVFVPIMRYKDILPGMQAEVMPDPPVGGVHKAWVKVVDRLFDTASGTFGVRLILQNKNYEIPAGAKCRVRFLADAPILSETELSKRLSAN
ncbi:MAG: efflux RND transporter periplasmic adaptor subunit [Pseudomonadota bacterium]